MTEAERTKLIKEIERLRTENLELLQRAGELPEMPRNAEGESFGGPPLIMARNRRGISVNDAAELLGVSRRDYIGFESETVAPTQGQIDKMSLVFGFPRKFFFNGIRTLIDPARISWRDPAMRRTSPDQLHVTKWYE